MQILGALLAAAGIAAALPGGGGDGGGGSNGGGYGGGGGYSPSNEHCITTSTCKAVYHTKTKTVPYHETKTITKTEYKPHVYTTKVPKVHTDVSYVPTQYYITKTVPVTKTVTVPDHSTTVVCHTSTVNFNRTSCITTWEHSTCPQTSKVPVTNVHSTWYENKVTTSTPCPYTTVEKKETWSTTVCTESSSKCETSSHCSSKQGYATKPTQYASSQPTYQA